MGMGSLPHKSPGGSSSVGEFHWLASVLCVSICFDNTLWLGDIKAVKMCSIIPKRFLSGNPAQAGITLERKTGWIKT